MSLHACAISDATKMRLSFGCTFSSRTAIDTVGFKDFTRAGDSSDDSDSSFFPNIPLTKLITPSRTPDLESS